MKYIVKYPLMFWAWFAGTIPDYTTELLLSSSRIRKWIWSCETEEHILTCSRAIDNLAFNYTEEQAQPYTKLLIDLLQLQRVIIQTQTKEAA